MEGRDGGVMDWIDAAKAFGPLGLVVLALYLLARDWMARHERIEMQKLKVEDKKADAFSTALISLGGKVDAHATQDIASHTEMAKGMARIEGKLDGVMDERERTPIEGIRRVTPVEGVPTGYYSHRPGTKGGR
jgi:hypothetical protein